MSLTQAIITACEGTEPGRARLKALAKVNWRLRSGLLYAGLDGLRCVLTDKDNALVFDGRDSERTKLRFWQAATGYKFEIELV